MLKISYIPNCYLKKRDRIMREITIISQVVDGLKPSKYLIEPFISRLIEI